MNPRLSIVEDDPTTREVRRIVFAHRGWDVAVASSASEGSALLDTPPDDLILDLLLTDPGGEAILRRVRDSGFKTGVAETTASDCPEYLSEIRARKPEALFEKPVDIAEAWREAG